MLLSIRRIAAFYRLIDRTRLALILVGATLLSTPTLVSLITPLMVRSMVDRLLYLGSVDYVLLASLGAVFFVSLLLSWYGEYLYNKHKCIAVEEMRCRVFQASFSFPARDIKTQGAPYYASLLGDHVNMAFSVLDYGIIRNVFLTLRMVVLFVVMASIDHFILAVMLGVLLSGIAYSRVTHARTTPIVQESLERARRLSSFVVETFDNLKGILAGRGCKGRAQSYREQHGALTRLAIAVESLRVTFDKLLVDLPLYVAQLVTLAYCGIGLRDGTMTVGTMWVLWTYIGYISMPIYVFRDLGRMMVQSAAAVDGILQFFDRARGFSRSGTDVVLTAPALAVSNLSVAYENAGVLKDVTITIDHGDCVGIMGVSGVGKSTLLDVLLGFNNDYCGDVRLMGRSIRDLTSDAVFSHVGYYSQDIAIFNDTLESNIMLGETFDARRMDMCVRSVDLSHLRGRQLGQGGSFVSSGERHRIQLARLLYADKPILILDEPLLNLDLVSEKLLLSKLGELVKGRTTVIISHRPEVLQMAETVLVLKEGSVIARGSLLELMSSNDFCRTVVTTYIDNAKVLGQLVGFDGSAV